MPSTRRYTTELVDLHDFETRAFAAMKAPEDHPQPLPQDVINNIRHTIGTTQAAAASDAKHDVAAVIVSSEQDTGTLQSLTSGLAIGHPRPAFSHRHGRQAPCGRRLRRPNRDGILSIIKRSG